MAVTHGNAGGDETLVATPPAGYTVGSKGITAGTNVELSSDADSVTITGSNAPSDSPVCIVRRATTLSVPNNTVTAIEWSNQVRDPYAMWVSTPDPERITVPEDGIYLINLVVRWSGHASADGYVATLVGVIGGGSIGYSYTRQVGSLSITTNQSFIYQLDASDQIVASAFNLTGQTVSMNTASFLPYFEVTKIRQQ